MTDEKRNAGQCRRAFVKMASAGALAIGFSNRGGVGLGGSAMAAQTTASASPPIDAKKTALLVMHYQTDVLKFVPSAAPTLLKSTRKLCDMARAKEVPVYFVKIQFTPGYPEISPLNKNGMMLRESGLFINDTIAPELGRRESEAVIVGRRINAFYDTDLHARLSAAGIDTLMLAGIESTGVVMSTVAYASDADFRLYTVKDCCYDRDPVVQEHLFSTAFDTRTHVVTLEGAAVLLA